MVIYGAIWYQGEANAGSFTYPCTFAKLIESWRQTWNERTNGSADLHFPFGFVQVSSTFIYQRCNMFAYLSFTYFQLSTYTNDSSVIDGYPVLRWHQTFDVGYVPNDVVPKVFMAVALDLRDDPNG